MIRLIVEGLKFTFSRFLLKLPSRLRRNNFIILMKDNRLASLRSKGRTICSRGIQDRKSIQNQNFIYFLAIFRRTHTYSFKSTSMYAVLKLTITSMKKIPSMIASVISYCNVLVKSASKQILKGIIIHVYRTSIDVTKSQPILYRPFGLARNWPIAFPSESPY